MAIIITSLLFLFEYFTFRKIFFLLLDYFLTYVTYYIFDGKNTSF